MDGATVLAKALHLQGIEYAFGIVGIPVVEVAMAFQAAGIKFVAMRNEQSASYAASAIGYLTGKPGVCLVVSGPGFVHALAGLSNANENCWPVIVIGGASDSHLDGSEAFQEFPQVAAAAKFCKYAARFPSIARIPHFVHRAIKEATYGRPGAVYLDLPGDFVTSAADDVQFPPELPPPPVTLADPREVTRAADLLRAARRPLVVVGKGAAYDRAEGPVRSLIEACGLPFLPTPMGKGVAPDEHEFCASAARTQALRSADLVLLLGARLNWILHFGRPPRLSEEAKFIQVDIHAEEFHTNVNCEVALCGNISAVVDQLISALGDYKFPADSEWWRELADAGDKNRNRVQALVASGQTEPMTYYSVLHELAQFMNKDKDDGWLVVSEGANTMDIGRTMLPNRLARRRLDAGTFGTMGVGLGFGVAADLCRGDGGGGCGYRRVLCLEGDSAIGFSLAELETMARYRMPVLLLVLNNSGIYSGVPAAVMDQLRSAESEGGASPAQLAARLPATALSSDCRYDLVAEAAGGVGRLVRSVAELRRALADCAAVTDRPCLINAIIDTGAERKQQEFDWLSRSKL